MKGNLLLWISFLDKLQTHDTIGLLWMKMKWIMGAG